MWEAQPPYAELNDLISKPKETERYKQVLPPSLKRPLKVKVSSESKLPVIHPAKRSGIRVKEQPKEKKNT